jgi:uncharacterized protein YdaU (DUF1376 family)
VEKRKLLAEWFWTDRWDGSSGVLLAMEPRGLYREMMTQAWRRGGRLPSDPEAIQRACRATREEWDRCWPVVQRFWREDDGYLYNDTQLEVLAAAMGAADAAKRRAEAAANKRWEAEREAAALREAEERSRGSGNAQALPEQCPPSPSPSPGTTDPPHPPNGGGSRLTAAVDRLARLRVETGHDPGSKEFRHWRRQTRHRLAAGVREEELRAPLEAARDVFQAERAAAAEEAQAHQQLLDEIVENGSRPTAVRLWDEALEQLQQRMNRHTFATWFRPITPRGMHHTPSGPRLILEVPNREWTVWLPKQYGEPVAEALHGVEVTYVVERGPPA